MQYGIQKCHLDPNYEFGHVRVRLNMVRFNGAKLHAKMDTCGLW